MSRVMRKQFAVSGRIKPVGNRSVFQYRLYVLHIHVLLVAPLDASYVAKSGADQYQSRIAIRETAHHPGAAADLPVETFYDIVCTDTRPVFTGKVTVSQCLFNTILDFLSGLSQLHGTKLLRRRFGLLPISFFALLGMDRLEHLVPLHHLRSRCHRKYIAVKTDGNRWYLASGNTSPTASSIPRHLSPTMSFTPFRPQPRSH